MSHVGDDLEKRSVLEEWVVKSLLDTSLGLEPKWSSLLTLSWITREVSCLILFGSFGLFLTSTLPCLRWVKYPIFESVCTWYAISLVQALTSLKHSSSLEELKVYSSPFLYFSSVLVAFWVVPALVLACWQPSSWRFVLVQYPYVMSDDLVDDLVRCHKIKFLLMKNWDGHVVLQLYLLKNFGLILFIMEIVGNW